MFILIAVSSLNGETVDFHFGKSKKLYIYKIIDDDYELIDERTVEISDDEKHQGSKVLEVCSDCDVIISQQFGPKSKMKAKKVDIKLVSDEGSIDDVIKRYINHVKFMNS